MIQPLEIAFVSYSDEDSQGSGKHHHGLWNMSPKASEFYKSLFGYPLEPGETPFAGEFDKAYDVDAAALGLSGPSKSYGKNLLVSGAIQVRDLNLALTTLKERKITVINELSTERYRLVIIDDPDKNLVAIFAPKPTSIS
jgi:hypothetical protein